MLTASSLLIALPVAALLGVAATAYLWTVRRHKNETAAGLKLLAAMRWREFSRLVTEALRVRGFEPASVEDLAERGQQSDLRLQRDGRTWLLSCKQGTDYKVTPAAIKELADAIRFNGAAGGLLATPGTVEADARKVANGNIELIDGAALWPLVRPQLTHGVRDELATKTRAGTVRNIALTWVAALLVGFGIAGLMPASDEATTPETTTASTDTQTAKNAPAIVLAPAPVSEDEQRTEVVRIVTDLPSVDRAIWTTRSTLTVYMLDDSEPVTDICAVLVRYDNLRTSRLHLQPPKGSQRLARFLQCRTY